jgi:predicted branched-subunit amino acid permease
VSKRHDIRRAFQLGLKDSFGLPAIGLVAALTGYGVMARDAGLDLTLTLVSVATVWAMPPLMAFVELLSSGSSLWLYFITLLVISFRNLPMAISAIPMIREKPGFKWHQILMAQLLSPTSWVQITVVGRTLIPTDRMPYYVGYSFMLLFCGMLGAWIGFSWTEGLPPALGLALLLLTPLFVILTMATSPKTSSRIALILGGVLVPVLMSWDAELGLILGGLAGGTAGFLVTRRFKAGKEQGR